ncbi:MAG: PAS domain-containing protein [Spirochaetales bacterium]|nr:PAS domain-containing protein [Spirochaetales bacterium]
MNFQQLTQDILEEYGPGILLLSSFEERRIIEANKQAGLLFETPLEELLGKHLDYFGNLELTAEYTGELQTITKPQRWLSLKGSKVSPESENLILILEDSTQTKARLKHLSRLESRWRRALESAGDGVWEIDLKSGKVYFSPLWKSMLGYSIGEIQGTLDQWDSLVHPDDLGPMKAVFRDHLWGRTPTYSHAHRIRKKDGSYLWVFDRGKVIETDKNEEPLRVVGTHTDISNLTGIQEKLSQTQAILEATTQIARIGGWELDPHSNNLIWNQMARDIHRIPKDYEVSIAKALSFYPGPEDRDRLKKAVLDCAKNRKSFDLHIRLQTYDGQLIWVRARGQAEEVRGQVRRVYGTIQDITDQKITEQILRDERTLLEQANQVKIRFLSSMSHELRTPLNAILGLSQYALSHAPDTQYQDFNQRILQSANQLLELVNNLLDYSNIESKQMKVQPEVVQLRQLVTSLVESLEPRAREKKLNLSLSLDSSLPTYLWIDRNLIGQIIDNLVSNGIKFTEEGSVFVRLWSTGGHFFIEVKDTGIGIPPEFLSKIFLPFTQQDSSDTRRFGGTGLGLSLVQRIVTLMGGAISTTSKPGKGSTFSVHLPIPILGKKDTLEQSLGKSRLKMGVLSPKTEVPRYEDLLKLGRDAGIDIVFEPERDVLGEFDGAFALGKDFSSAEEVRNRFELSQTFPVLWISSPPPGIRDSFLPLPPSDQEFFQAFASGFLNPLSSPQIAKILIGLPVLYISTPGVEQNQIRGYLESFGLWVSEMNFGSQIPTGCQDVDFRCIFIDLDKLAPLEAIDFWKLYPDCVQIPVVGLSSNPGTFRDLPQSPWERILEKPIRKESLLRSLYVTVLLAEDLQRMTEESQIVLDYEKGLARIEGDKELYDQMLASFVDEAPAIISNLKEACRMNIPVGDWPDESFQRIGFLIHRLKGISAGIEATNLFYGCIGCERAIQVRQVTQEHIDSMVKAIQQVTYAIEQKIATGLNVPKKTIEDFSLSIVEDVRHGIQERLILDSTLLQELGDRLGGTKKSQNLFQDFKKKVWSLQYDEANDLLDSIEAYLKDEEA